MTLASAPLPHHDGSPLHVDDLAPALGDVVNIRLRVPIGYGPLDRVVVRADIDHEPAWFEAALIGTADGWDWWQAALRIGNPVQRYRWALRHEDGRFEWLTQAGLSRIETLDAQDFAIVATAPAPSWLPDAVMYQIFPDRFARSAAADDRELPDWAIPAEWDDPVDPVLPARVQQFYGGDLDGITEHLDHLERLGVTVLYLTPVFPAASNHRYDASSFTEVDPLLGGDEAYIRFIEAAHARGMKVIGDLTSNHSGDRHEWFRAAHRHPEAPESSFYYFLDEKNEEYVGWLGTPTLPKFDWSSEELRRRFIDGPDSVVGRWLLPPFNLDGWRIDVANMTGRMGDVDLNAEVRQTIRRTMDAIDPDLLLVAEITNDASGDLQGDAWHGAMTYPGFTRPLWCWLGEEVAEPHMNAEGELTSEPWFFGQPITRFPRYTARDFADAVVRFTASIPWRVRLGNMQPLDTHDTGRFASFARPGTIPLAVGLSMTLPGIPVVFAGDEFGAHGVDGEASRTPIPWSDTDSPEAASRIDLYRALIGLRRAHPVLATGGLRWVHVSDDAVVFVRESAEESVLVVAGSGESVSVGLPAEAVPGMSAAQRVFGELALAAAGDAVRITGSGPAFGAWVLPGVAVPAGGAA